MKAPQISIILPCRNEEQSIGFCLRQVKEVIKKNNLDAEIIVSDSSTDKSEEIARKHNVILVKHKIGFGDAYLEAFKVARGKFIFMADSDSSYDFNEIPNFINELEKGYDFVIGDRFKGNMEKGSMPLSHKYIGNPFLSGLFRVFFHSNVQDIHCGMRAISKKALEKLDLQTTGMEFASEMVLKAVKKKLKIKELTINYYKRRGKSKLNTYSDGFRHLRFMLLYSPSFLFFAPGFVFFILGLVSFLWLYLSPEIFGIKLFYHPMFLSSLMMIAGYQIIFFGAFAKTYLVMQFHEKDTISKFYDYMNVKIAVIIGGIVLLAGAFIYISIFAKWLSSGLGDLNEAKNSIIGLTFIILGLQTIFSSFILSILGIRKKS